jgi:hypothetical protein
MGAGPMTLASKNALPSLESSQHQLIDIIILSKLKTKKSRYDKYINKGIYINV